MLMAQPFIKQREVVLLEIEYLRRSQFVFLQIPFKVKRHPVAVPAAPDAGRDDSYRFHDSVQSYKERLKVLKSVKSVKS
jgi:hypothetical protein